MLTEVPSDIDIVRQIELKAIDRIAEQLGIGSEDLQHYGKYKAKLPLTLISPDKVAKSNLILESAISPQATLQLDGRHFHPFEATPKPRRWSFQLD